MRVGQSTDGLPFFIKDSAHWALAGIPLSLKAIPVIVLQEMLNEQHYIGALTLEYVFNTKDLSKNRKVWLVLEHPEYHRITVNGKVCHYEGLEHWLDIRFMPIDISGKVVNGINKVRLEYTTFKYGDKTSINDTVVRYGTEIESIYIVGDFAVQGQYASPEYDETYWKRWNLSPELTALKADTALITDPVQPTANNLTETGLPFYAGRVEYDVTLPEIPLKSGQRLNISMEKLNAACAEVFVNEISVGTIVTPPYQLDITESYRSGKQLRIILYSTLRNLLGPHHHTDGEVIFNSPLSFLPEKGAYQDYSNMAVDWLKGSVVLNDWNDDYCLLNIGDLGKVSLRAYRDKT